MYYKILGFAVWKGVKWLVRVRFGDKPRKIAAATVVLAALATGAVLAARQTRSS
jgi:predicted PurR-regulated permease PerM